MTGSRPDRTPLAPTGEPAPAAALHPIIEAIKSDLCEGVRDGHCLDAVFIGNASSVYHWTPCFMVDMDVFLFVRVLDPHFGRWLLQRSGVWRAALQRLFVDFELRIIEGPYKPAIAKLKRPIIVLHLGVFTESSYLASASVKRWSWRKYKCVAEPDRLARLAPPRPDATELLYGPRGIEYRLNAVASGAVAMRELVLPSFREAMFTVSVDQANFAECCFAYALSSARNHGRVLALTEADTLTNETYFAWYNANILRSESLLELFDIKMRCRNAGFDVEPTLVRSLAVHYLQSLSDTLRAMIEAERKPKAAPLNA